MSEESYGESLHLSLIRPQLILGCDREALLGLLFFTALIIGPLGLFMGNFWLIPVGIIIWFVGYFSLIRMGKIDPYMRKVFMKSITQYPWYPAVANAAESDAYTDASGKLLGSSCAGLLPYAALIDRSIVLLKDGSLLCCIEYTGADLTTATEEERYEASNKAAIALTTLGDGFTVWFEAIRVSAPVYPSGKFSEIVTYCIDRERKLKHEQEGVHFETRLFIFIKWQPQTTAGKIFNGIGSLFKKKVEQDETKEIVTDEEIRQFITHVDDFISSFRMAFDVDVLTDTELLNIISLCVTGKNVERPMPEIPWALDSLLGCDIENGEPFMFDDQFVKVVALDGFPEESIPCMLMWLGQLPFEYRWSTRFSPMDWHTAYNRMTKEQRKWVSKSKPIFSQLFGTETATLDKDAIEQADDANEAISDLQRGGVAFGEMTSVIIVRDSNYAEVERKARDVVRVLQECLFMPRIEKRNTLEAFFGSLPGDTISDIRRPVVKSTNLSHFIMLSSPWSGLKFNPCSFYAPNSPCLIQASSQGGNPFRLNLHSGDLGHTLILGPTGSGKSTLLATIAAQFDRYRNKTGASQVFIFDKGRSMYPLISAMQNASFYELGADNDELRDGEENPSLCPLSSLETTSDRAWAVNYIEILVQLNGGQITPACRKEITKAINDMATGTNNSSQRSLTDFQINVQDEKLKDTLMPFCEGGSFGRYLDGTQTNIKYSRYTCFEIERLMNLGQKIITPVLLYIFHEIEKRLDGRPSLIILDEAWVPLQNPLFAAQIAEWLRVLRKANCAVILATQSLSQVLESDVSKDIFESCKTRILLANPEANSGGMQALYTKHLRLSETETNAIANATPKREYFFVNPDGKRMFSLNLGALQLSFVGAAGKEDLRSVEKYKKQYGKKWPIMYLDRERNLPDWAEYMSALYKKYSKV